MRKYGLILWLLLWPLLGWLFWTPVADGMLKVALLLVPLSLLLLSYVLFPRIRSYLLGFTAFCVLCLAFIGFYPARPVATSKLQSAYITELKKYLGTKYIWGGENGRGIDCSGLMRRAMEDSLVVCGWQERNPALWRGAASIWWHDCSAREMKAGNSGQIVPLFETRDLNSVNLSPLHPGDLAVTRSGVHVLAYLGAGTWIQADPNLAEGGDKVITTTAPSKNGWFRQRMVICRWKNLA